MKVITHTITHQAKSAGGYSYSIMYPAKFAGGRSRLDLLLPSFLPSREEKKKQERRKQSIDSGAEWHNPHMDRVRIETKKQDRIFCPLRGHAVGRMQYAPTTCRQETLFPINSREERIETKIQEQKNRPLGSRGVLHMPHMDRVRTETKMQERIFCPLRGHVVGRMQYAPTTCRQEMLFPINSREERIETKIQEQKNRPLGSRGVLHTPHMNRVRIETKKQEQKNRPLGCRAQKHTPYTDRVRTETKKQDRIFCPLRGHSVGRMQYAPTSCQQETLFPINSREERTKMKTQEQKNRPLGSRGVLHTPHMNRVRTETKMQERIKQSIDSSAEWHNPHMDFERTETKMQERIKQSIDSGAEWHTPFMRHGERDAVWRDTFLEQRARVAIWRDRRLEEKSSHESLQMRISGENSKPYKSSLVALSEQLRDIFAA